MEIHQPVLTRRQVLAILVAEVGVSLCSWSAEELATLAPQPYFAAVNRALEALAKLGAPVATEDAEQIAVLTRRNDRAAIDAAEKILDRYTLTRVGVETDGYARTTAGGAERTLVEQGWRLFLVRVSNPLGSMDKLNVAASGGHLTSLSTESPRAAILDTLNDAPHVAKSWLISQLYEGTMTTVLSGFPVEYRVIQLYSRDPGRRNVLFSSYTATDKQAAFIARTKHKRKSATLNFDCLPSRDIGLRVLDADGRGCMASITIKDRFDRIYPAQAMRLAPDMQFHPHIYRADGENVRLPDGDYTIESWRGPEYLRGIQATTIGEGLSEIEVRLNRWIDPAKWAWYSGDAHIHAGGCSHYERPTEAYRQKP